MIGLSVTTSVCAAGILCFGAASIAIDPFTPSNLRFEAVAAIRTAIVASVSSSVIGLASRVAASPTANAYAHVIGMATAVLIAGVGAAMFLLQILRST